MPNISKKSTKRTCIICHKKSYKVSSNGLCINCSVNKIQIARFQIKCKEGPIYEKWKRKLVAGIERAERGI